MDESEEFEFRLRAEKEAQAPPTSAPTPEPQATWGGAVKGVADVAATIGSGIAQQVVGVPKHVAQLAEQVTQPLSRMTPEQQAMGAKLDAEPGVTEKLQGLLSHQPSTEEGKYLLGKIQALLSPVAAVEEAAHQGIYAVAGEPAAALAGDVVGLSGVRGLGSTSVTAKALEAATSTQSKVQRVIQNLSGGRSLEKADVGQAAQKAVRETSADLKKAGTEAYEDLSKAMPPGTSVKLTESTKAAEHHGAGLVVDPKVKAVAEKLKSVDSMTFDSLKTLRTQISDLMGSDRNVNRQLRGLRDAVTKDIEKRAEDLSPEAKKAWDTANAKWKEFTSQEDALNKILGKRWEAKTPAEMYQKVLTTAQKDPQKITQVMGAIKDPAVRKQFVASVLHHMADTGGDFDGDKMVRVWGSMDPQARKALFSSIGGGYEANMTRLVDNLKRIREGHRGLIKEVAGVGVASLLSHFLPGGTKLVGAVTLAREAYKFGPKSLEAYLTSPQWVRTLANRTTAALSKGTAATVVTSQQTDPQRYTLADQSP